MKWTWLDIRQPEEVLDYVVTVDTRGEAISNVNAEASSPDITVSNVTPNGSDVTLWVTGGVSGLIYTIKLLATTAGGRTFSHEVVVPVGTVMREPDALDFLQACYKVRRFMRDLAARNQLLMNELEFEWDEYELAVENALALWNGTPPLTSETLTTLDKRARRILYLDTTAYLLQMGSHHQARNNIAYSDQGFSVNENDKASTYMSLASTLMQQADLERRRLKTAQNMDATWGGTHHTTYDDAGLGGGSSLFGYPGESF